MASQVKRAHRGIGKKLDSSEHVAGSIGELDSFGGDSKLSDQVSDRGSGAKHICGVGRTSPCGCPV
jgi:hypothetical protein